MMKPSNRRRAAKWMLPTAWLIAATGGCAVFDAVPFKLPEPRIPDVKPIMRERNDEAVRDFDRRRNEAQFLAAQTAWRHADYVRCLESIEKILDRDPKHRGALLLSADVALETKKPDEAVDVLRRVLAEDPHDAEIAYRLGLALETTGKVAEALPYLKQAATAAPDNVQYADALAEAELELNPPAAAKADAKTPAGKYVAQAESVAASTPRVVDATHASAKPAAKEEKKDAEFAAALSDWEQNKVVDCAAKLNKLLERRPDHIEANILQAELDLNGGQTAAALRRMDRLVLRHPRNVQVRQACGLVNEAAGNAEKAALFFAEAESLAEADALVTVAYEEPLTEATTNDAEAAQPVDAETLTVPELPQLAGTQPAEDAAAATTTKPAADREPAALLDEGQASLQAGRVTEAAALLRAAVERAPNDPQTAVTAAVAALKLEQPELALELATVGTTASPRSAPLHRIRGMAAYRLGRYSEAETALQQSLNLDNSQALSYFLLGSAQKRLGKTETAERNLREAARLDARYAARK